MDARVRGWCEGDARVEGVSGISVVSLTQGENVYQKENTLNLNIMLENKRSDLILTERIVLGFRSEKK